MTRTRATVRPGQIWQSSDPKRLSAFKITAVFKWPDYTMVWADSIYPIRPPHRTFNLESFQVLGDAGYMLMKDVHD